jgi:hypothetical protein
MPFLIFVLLPQTVVFTTPVLGLLSSLSSLKYYMEEHKNKNI